MGKPRQLAYVTGHVCSGKCYRKR